MRCRHPFRYGSDGAQGIKAVHAAGGVVFAQDVDSSVSTECRATQPDLRR